MTEQNPAMSRFDRVMAALEHPTQHSSEQGYPEPDLDDPTLEISFNYFDTSLVEEREYVYDLAFGLWCHIDPDGRRYPVQVLSII